MRMSTLIQPVRLEHDTSSRVGFTIAAGLFVALDRGTTLFHGPERRACGRADADSTGVLDDESCEGTAPTSDDHRHS